MLPAILVSPPWVKAIDSVPQRPAVEVPPKLVWNESERRSWLSVVAKARRGADTDDEVLDSLLERVEGGRRYPESWLGKLSDNGILDFLDEAGVKISLATARYAIARLEERALPMLVKIARRRSPNMALIPAFEYAVSTSLIELMLGLFAEQSRVVPEAPKLRNIAFTPSDLEAWLERFAAEAALVFLPWGAADSPSKRAASKCANIYLSGRGHRAALLDAARRALAPEELPPFGQFTPLASLQGEGLDWIPLLAAHDALEKVAILVEGVDHPALAPLMQGWRAWGSQAEVSLAEGWLKSSRSSSERGDEEATWASDQTLNRFPERIPNMPGFWEPRSLPVPRLVSGEPLPLSAVNHLGTMLRFSALEPPYAGIAQVRAACDEDSLDVFAAALLSRFELAGLAGTDLWCTRAAGLIGGPKSAGDLIEFIGRVAARRAPFYQGPGWLSWHHVNYLVSAAYQALGANGSDVARAYIEERLREGCTKSKFSAPVCRIPR